MTDELTARLRAVFVESLCLAADADVEALRFQDIRACDPIGHLTLVTAIEDEFDVEFDTDQVIDMTTFAIARDMVLIELLAGSILVA